MPQPHPTPLRTQTAWGEYGGRGDECGGGWSVIKADSSQEGVGHQATYRDTQGICQSSLLSYANMHARILQPPSLKAFLIPHHAYMNVCVWRVGYSQLGLFFVNATLGKQDKL